MKIKFTLKFYKIIRHISLMILFFVMPFGFLGAQTWFFEKYGVEQGLGSSKVYSVLQDENNWIWLGTESGVSRFDGSKFENFTSASGMAGGGVFSIHEDTIGRIWFGHLNGGLSLFDGYRFIKLKFDSIDIDGDITSINQVGKQLWITTFKNGAILTDLPGRGDTILSGRQYSGKDGLGDQVSGSCIDNNRDFFCIVPAAGIRKFNREKNIFETFLPANLTKYFDIIVMYQDRKGNYWYGTHNGGLYKDDVDSGKMRVFDMRDGLAKNMISYVTEDYRGNIWVGTFGGGITVFEGEKMKIYNKSNGLEATSIHCILEDKERNMIIADHYNGISVYKGDHFSTYSDEKILPDKSVFAIEADDAGRYWFGTNAGISVFDPGVPGNNIQFYNDARNAIGNKIRFLEKDRNGNIWIGTDGNGLFMYDARKKKFIFDPNINGYFNKNGTITAMTFDRDGKLWIGNMDRLVVWNGAKEEVAYYTQRDGLAGNYITVLFCDRDNNIWIGSEDRSGLTKYITGAGKFKVIGIGEGYVPKCIAQTKDSRIWVGTTGGLLILENDSVTTSLNEGHGLLSSNIKLLQNEGDNYLYIGTNLGLNRYDLTDSTIASFTKRNGFSGIETLPNASISDSKGNLWFGTANGVTLLVPGKMPPVDTKPTVHISSMAVNMRPRDMKKDLKLNYKEKSVVFTYYSVCLTDPDAVKYRVILEGAESEWKPATGQTIEDYPTLSPGHYTFRVKASNSYGYWNEEPVDYSFTIKPPFYQSLWFIATCLVLAAIGIISYIKLRERNLIREKRILEAKVEERTAEVVQKSMEIEEKNRDITASIRYAKRIQRAMLPREDTLKDTFVLFLPKDIVSGDFYWMYDNGDTQFIAACDCTGHGVPGAFMSIIGHNSLNKVVRELGILKPGPILNQLNIEVVKALTQRNEEIINDGMDMTLIAFNRKKFQLEFAGAYNPLYVVRDSELFTYKSDRFPIGMSSIEAEKSFENQIIDIKPGDMIYMCSDGYADQFGTAEVKKYKSGNVKKLLLRICHLPVEEQRNQLLTEILDWKGNLQQVDDILFIGTRIPEPER
jgi:ligand-binding sensor domain-containing protein/serine phosphatase RsbU (regulator of sigma subunit)